MRHGWWIPVDEENDAFDCSECDVMVTKQHNYCPSCGAKMDLFKVNWVSINDRLPSPEEEVRLFCKTKFGTYQCQGFYIPDKMNEQDSEFCWDYEALDYDEEDDINYIHQGWYERIYNWSEYGAVAINDEVLYQVPLPENPEGWEE